MSDKIHSEASEAFKAAVDHESENRANALHDVKFARLGEQWPDKVRQDRERDGRPCLVINRMPAFCRQVVNDARQNRPQITVTAVDSASDPRTAEILGGLVRHIERNSDADVAYDTAIESAIYGGFGYWTIEADYAADDGFEQELYIRRVVNPFSIYGDPDSEAADSSDWKCAFQLHTLSPAEFKSRYKGFDPVSWPDESENNKERDDKTIEIARYWKVEQESKNLVLLSSGASILEDELDEDRKAQLALAECSQTLSPEFGGWVGGCRGLGFPKKILHISVMHFDADFVDILPRGHLL